jgi:hypothetical protein
MPTTSRFPGVRVLAAACLFVCLESHAQTSAPLYSTVHTVAASTTGVPVEETFNISTAGTYQITLTDLGAQLTPAAPLASVKLAITGGSSQVTLTAATGSTVTSNALIGAGTATFSAQAGTYTIHVVGAPTKNSNGTTVPGSGPISMLVATSGGATQVQAFSDVLAFPPSNVQNNVGTLNDKFTVQSSGNYTVTLTDMQMPAPLTTLQLAIAVQGGSLVTPTNFGTSSGNPVATATVALTAGVNYGIFAGGQAGGALKAGLYGVSITPAGGGTPAYTSTVPVGSVVSLGTPALTAANYTVTLADLAYPAALSQVGVAMTLNGQSVVSLAAPGTSSAFAATATKYQVFAVGVAASGSQGTYAVTLQPSGGTPVLSVARAVTDSASGVYTYSYDSTTVGSQTYNLDLGDFGYPTNFASLKAVAVQNGAQVGTLQVTSGAAGTKAITPAAGPITLIVFAQPTPAPSSSSTGGLFGIDLTASGAGVPAFDTTQAVGQLFSAQKVTISTGGQYQVAINDLGFPANFANLAVIVTRGTSSVASFFGGGTRSFTAAGGDYFLNIVAQPGGTDAAGTYAMLVQPAPPAATVTLQAASTTVSSGGTTSLTWSSSNTSSCAASSSPAGAWSGTVATSGTATSAALTSTTTFTLTCVGTDGTNPTQSVTVTVSSGSSGGGGHGGGSISIDLIAVLLGLVATRALPGRSRQ